MSEPQGFLIRDARGREYELENSKAGIAVFTETYKPQGFKVVTNPHPDFAVPDLSEPKKAKEADAKADAKKDGDA